MVLIQGDTFSSLGMTYTSVKQSHKAAKTQTYVPAKPAAGVMYDVLSEVAMRKAIAGLAVAATSTDPESAMSLLPDLGLRIAAFKTSKLYGGAPILNELEQMVLKTQAEGVAANISKIQELANRTSLNSNVFMAALEKQISPWVWVAAIGGAVAVVYFLTK